MSIKIAHIADVHFRSLSRHQEYREVFQDFAQQCRELKPDVIYVGGDIYHTKTQGISPELIDEITHWMRTLADTAPLHMILGNHDGNLVNASRQDAITPIFDALDHPNAFLYKKSGIYPTGVPGYNWAVFSCFDEEGWKDVKPVEGEINIATFHGCVVGSKTDQNWELEGDVPLNFFDPYDFTMLGDIHKFQILNEEKTIAYPGSTVQQNYGEDPDKGFIFWDIRSGSDFDLTFHRLTNPHPFVTVDWQGSVRDTLHEAKKYKKGSRFRLRTTENIPQLEIKQIHNELKLSRNAKEVVWKFDQEVDANDIIDSEALIKKEDLRDPKIQMKILGDYAPAAKFDEEEWEEISKLVDRYIALATQDEDVARNIKWSIKDIEFDNVFSYGKGNKINFEKLNGITGILGKNRSGKSSIVGTLVYTLFNSTDRGTIKNLHVINSRKGHCNAKMRFTANNKRYVVERQSVRKEDKKGHVSAITSLNFYQEDPMGNVVEDLNGEQRTQTEKIIRKMLGTAEDFLITSLATQGSMNHFISHGSSHRKTILSKFLDLDIFERMAEFVKHDSASIRGKMSNYPERDWNASIVSLRNKRRKYDSQIEEIEYELAAHREDQQKLQIQLSNFTEADLVDEREVDEQKEELRKAKEKFDELTEKCDQCVDEIEKLSEQVETIEAVKEQFPISEIREQYENLQDLERALTNLEHQREVAKQLYKSQERSVKILDEVPCGDEFPTCKFIKDSHKNSRLITKQKEIIDDQSSELRAIRRAVKKLQDQNLKEKIDKYDTLLTRLSDTEVKVSRKQSEYDLFSRDLDVAEEHMLRCKKVLVEMKLRVNTSNLTEAARRVKDMLDDINSQIKQKDAQRISAAEMKGNTDSQIKKLQTERDEFAELRKTWKMYDFLMKSWSKKGIPTQIIRTQLPVINSEIEKILSSVADFTVKLDADVDSNALDIYLDYGDSKRIIELASGMEKMISSLAMRVALLNVSSLPKTDMLIIDEGFGALDETNVEACNRLLTSLKKWFKNILVITHVDAVKDVVDQTIEIGNKGIDSYVELE